MQDRQDFNEKIIPIKLSHKQIADLISVSSNDTLPPNSMRYGQAFMYHYEKTYNVSCSYPELFYETKTEIAFAIIWRDFLEDC